MKRRLWAGGLVVVSVLAACGTDDEPLSSSETIGEAVPWAFTLELGADHHAAAGLGDAELAVEVVRGIGEEPDVVHRARLGGRSTKIDLDLVDAVGIDVRIDGALVLAIDRPYWNQIYDGRIKVRIRRAGLIVSRRIPAAGCRGGPKECRQVSDRITVGYPPEVFDEIRSAPVSIKTTKALRELVGNADVVVRMLMPSGDQERVLLSEPIDNTVRAVNETLDVEPSASLSVSVGDVHSAIVPPEVWRRSWSNVKVTLDHDQIVVKWRILVGQRLEWQQEHRPVAGGPSDRT